MPKLLFLDPPHAGRTYEFVVEKTTVGRASSNTLVIQDDSISQQHCEILVHGTEVIVRDLGSSNGTVVDGRRLSQRQQSGVKTGGIIRFGNVPARLVLEESDRESQTATDITAVHAFSRARKQAATKTAAPNPRQTLAGPGHSADGQTRITKSGGAK